MGNYLCVQPPSTKGEDIAKPEDMKQLNDSVWELHKPTTDTTVEVIFFHGLQRRPNYDEAYWKTWMSRDGNTSWPKEWLSKSIPKARILSISYSSYAPQHKRETDAQVFAENLIYDLIEGADLGQACPVVFVGHSLGGIIIKEFILGCITKKETLNRETYPKAVEKIEKFLTNTKGVFYYSTPDEGFRIAGDRATIPIQNKAWMKLLKILSKENSAINNSFSNLHIRSDEINEGSNGKNKVRAMQYASQDVDHSDIAPEANHFNICKPKNNKDEIFVKLVTFINDVVGGNGENVASSSSRDSETSLGRATIQMNRP